MGKEYKYRAFISYSHKDKAFAKWLHKRIENYKIPKSLREKYPHLPKNLKRSIFRDEEELPTSSVLGDNLKYALDHSQKLIVICSPSAVQSKWVTEEIRYFKEVHGEYSVLAILKDGVPKASSYEMHDDKEEAFPKSLRYEVGEDGKLTNKETEPLAGDARKGNDKEMALMKLIAGVLGVDFADLWEREKREARKRKAIFTSVLALFVALAFYIGLQSNAISSKQELKLIQREIIKIESKLKKEQEQSAIDKLTKKLKVLKKQEKNKKATIKQFGLTDTKLAEEAKIEYDNGDKQGAIAVLESHNKDITNEQLLLARIYIEEHQYEKAKKSYQVATLLECSYSNILEYANFLNEQNEFQEIESLYQKLDIETLQPKKKSCITHNLGVLYSNRNKLDKAQKSFKEALKIRRSLAQKNPTAYTPDVAMTLNNLANLYKAKNELVKAEEAYNEALKLRRPLAQKNPSAYTSNVAMTLSNLANLYSDKNELVKAEEVYTEALKLYRTLAEKNPSAYNPDMATTLNNLGALYRDKNELEKAEEAYSEALKISRALAQKNPSAYTPNVAMTLNNWGVLYSDKNELEKSEEAYSEALKYYRTLAQKNPSAYTSDVAMTLNNLVNLGLLYVNAKKYNQAIKLFTKLINLKPKEYLVGFINLYELQIIMNEEVNSTLENSYIKGFSQDKHQFMSYELLKIIKDIGENRKVDISKWQKKYQGMDLDWNLERLKTWAKTLKDEKIKKRVYEALEIFEKHK